MNLKEYEEKAKSTAIYPKEVGLLYCTLKLAGEAGEVAEKVGKVLRDNGGVFSDEVKEKLAYELGDVLWYISNLSGELGYTLEEVAQMNLDKLASRKERGKIQGSGDER